jgi:hypothetical protein
MARSRSERKRDTLTRLERDVDAWVATSGPAGARVPRPDWLA